MVRTWPSQGQNTGSTPVGAILSKSRCLGVVRDGVLEGGRTLGNIIKYILMGTSSNFGNMFSMAGAAMFLPFLPMLPIQILVNNFLYDLSEVAIPTDQVDEEFVRRPHRWDIKFIRRFMTVIGPVTFTSWRVPRRSGPHCTGATSVRASSRCWSGCRRRPGS